MFEAKILADSISPEDVRLVTFQVTFPRFILAELNTHRMFSRNSASSRAIPTEKLIAQVVNEPFIPEFNQRVKGMGVGDPLDDLEAEAARAAWLQARDNAVGSATKLLYIDKSRVNRLLEPFMRHTTLVTATDWSNFFALRTDVGAQPEFRKLAVMMRELYESNQPWYCPSDCWHLPLVALEELGSTPDYPYWKQVCTGRCARVSFLTHDGKRDTAEDVGLHNRLLGKGHFSPFEHPARPFTLTEWEMVWAAQDELNFLYKDQRDDQTIQRMCRQLEYCGNLHGWKSYRYEIPNQHDFSLVNQ